MLLQRKRSLRITTTSIPPRYVDTFEEEAPVDIDAVHAEIAEIEIAAVQAKINEYLKEIGL